MANWPRKVSILLKTPNWKKGIVKKQKTKGNGDKRITRVNCYNCGRKGHYTQDCPKPSKVPFPTKIPYENVCSHTFVANSLPQWIEDTGANKHIVQDKAGFVDFHLTRWVHELSICEMAARKMSLE